MEQNVLAEIASSLLDRNFLGSLYNLGWLILEKLGRCLILKQPTPL